MSIRIVLTFLLLNSCNSVSLVTQGIQYKKCDCSVFINQSDCNENCYGDWCLDSNCIWDGSKCQNFKCSTLGTKKTCDKFPNCYFNIQGSCVEFQSCSQLDNQINSCCGQNCYTPDPQSTSTKCLSSPYKSQKTCSSITTQSECMSSQQNQYDCIWLNASCIQPTCSIFTSKSDCSILTNTCIYINGSCKQLSCDNLTSQSDCSTIYDLANDMMIQCMFIQNKCINPTLDQLYTQDLCSVGTLDTYAFISGSCQQCQQYQAKSGSGSVSSGKTLVFIWEHIIFQYVIYIILQNKQYHAPHVFFR